MGGGGADAFDAAEAGEEGALAGGADAGDVVEGAFEGVAVADLAVKADGGAVGLVAHPLEEVDLSAVLGQDDGGFKVGLEDALLGAGDSADGFTGEGAGLGEADDIKSFLEAEFLEGGVSGGELASAAVDDDQIGCLLLAFGDVAEAAGDDLEHGGEVVLFGLADLVSAVGALGGLGVDEDDLRGDDGGVLEVGDVVALNAGGEAGEVEGFL